MLFRIAVIVLLWITGPAAAAEIGRVERVQGLATGILGAVERPLAAGLAVSLGETIVTASGARAAIVLDDGTAITLGESARLIIDRFVYDPAAATTIHANVTGAFRYVSGVLSAGRHEASVTTPAATIGVRGTDFWGGPIDGRFGVALFSGVVTVTAGGQTVTLEVPGAGANLGGGLPLSVTMWPQEKVARALAAVAFGP
jgi:hypothetical protein